MAERRCRGGIPVAKFRTQEAKTRSRSRVRDPDYNEQDPEHDMFTLLEDNIALKEENKSLKLEIQEQKNKTDEVLYREEKLANELFTLRSKQSGFEIQIKELSAKYLKFQSQCNALEKMRIMKEEEVEILSRELELLRNHPPIAPPRASTTAAATAATPVIIGSLDLKRNLLKILPTLGSYSNDMESLIDVNASTLGVPITGDLVERLVEEFLALKQSTNVIELQLYEANEKMSELLENQHHLMEENETLRTENANLTKVAKLLTENMKESVETSKKMESALMKLKQRNEELLTKARDQADGLPAPVFVSSTSIETSSSKVNNDDDDADADENLKEIQNVSVVNVAEEQQREQHNERIVEMQNLMDAAIEKTTNDELKKLQLKLEILEEQLRAALTRAECAENELEKYKKHDINTDTTRNLLLPPPPPPPLPPPLPERLLYQRNVTAVAATAAMTAMATIDSSSSDNTNIPMLHSGGSSFNDNIAAHNLHKANNSNSNKIIDNVKQQVQAQAATGLDAIVSEFKSGRVTLRRNRRKTHTNEALQEMFQVLEISQKQNRSSKICVDMQNVQFG